MQEIKIGFKTYKIIEPLEDGSFIAERKGKQYLIRDTHQNLKEYYHLLDSYKRFANTGIKHAKIRGKDKKRGLVVIDYIQGETVFDMLKNDDLPEIVYEKIFLMAYMAKVEKKSLNFNPELFKFDGKELYYTSEELYEFNDETKFINKGIRLWFYTREFVALLNEKGLTADKSRIKEDYVVNKQIVLMTCKYYH